MTHFAENSIRRHKNGSIDTAYYLSKSHYQRSLIARDRSRRLLALSGEIVGTTASYAVRTARALVAFL